MLDFKINPNEVDKIGELSKEEKVFRVKQLDYFNKIGFPNKRDEDWKFSDLREIFLKNFNKLEFNLTKPKSKKIDFIKEFEHNFIFTINGKLATSDFKFEDKNSINIKNFKNDDFSTNKVKNSLVHLNHALSENGFFLETFMNNFRAPLPPHWFFSIFKILKFFRTQRYQNQWVLMGAGFVPRG